MARKITGGAREIFRSIAKRAFILGRTPIAMTRPGFRYTIVLPNGSQIERFIISPFEYWNGDLMVTYKGRYYYFGGTCSNQKSQRIFHVTTFQTIDYDLPDKISHKEAAKMLKKGVVEVASVSDLTARIKKEIKEGFEKNETRPPSLYDRFVSFWYRYRPALKSATGRKTYFYTAETPKDFATYISKKCLHNIKRRRLLRESLGKTPQEIFEIFRNARPVILIGGYRGVGKTTALNEIEQTFATTSGTNVALIEMDSYFKSEEESTARGGWDNPRNSHLDRLAKAIKDFKSGKIIRVPVGRIPRHGEIQTKEINPHDTPVLVVEGIHALNLKISKLGDVKAFMYIPPGLQIVRTWARDLDLSKRDKAAKMPPEYYTGINTRVRDWHNRFIFSRMKDAEIVYEAKWTKGDVDKITGFLGIDAETTKRFLDGWGIPYE